MLYAQPQVRWDLTCVWGSLLQNLMLIMLMFSILLRYPLIPTLMFGPVSNGAPTLSPACAIQPLVRLSENANFVFILAFPNLHAVWSAITRLQAMAIALERMGVVGCTLHLHLVLLAR